MSRAAAYQRAHDLGALGRRIFFDPSLSASGRMACATCHDPMAAFGPSNDRAVQLGGADLHQPGLRAVPSLTYLQAVPQFTEHYFESDDEGDESIDNGPTGGLTWDGRADRGRDQATFPLLSPYEMANTSVADVAAKAARADYAGEVRRLFGATVFSNPADAFHALTAALEVFEEDPAAFYPYSSKYDAFLAGRVELTPQEQRGLALFEDPAKGNCAKCHMSERAGDGAPPQFTDYGFVALGMPRNPDIPANSDPAYFDLGLCGPLRTDLRNRPDYCGLFIAPTLRNVALRHTFFHNGVIHSLHDAVAFYATRDSDPARWYPHDSSGQVRKYDDLPQQYQGNVETGPPFGQHPGDPPALTEAEIEDVVAFLGTLTDGYTQAKDQSACARTGSPRC